MSILFAILLFSFLIFIHELGHFIAAKLSGVQVNEFSVFMGPAILKKQVGETLYSLRLIPIGGYCAMEGEDGGSDNPRSFDKAAWWKRLIILVAGAAMNFITGLILLGIYFAPSEGFVVPVVSQIEPECYLAQGEGIRSGDRILKVDGERIYTASDFDLLLTLNPEPTHKIQVLRDGKKVVLPEVLAQKREFPDGNGGTQLRYGLSFTAEKATFGSILSQVGSTAVDTVRLVRLSLQMLLTGKAGLKDVGGPVMIVGQMAQVAGASASSYQAFMSLIYFGAFIAINLAVMNLLPIPALDGGRVVALLITLLVEKITGKKVDPKYEGYINGVGMMLLMALMAIIMFKDILFLFKG